MEDKNLTSYSFIASLHDTGTDIYQAVYLPLCKRAMSLYAQQHTHGSASDIQSIIMEEYGINIPLIITQKLIKAIEKDLSKREKKKFGYETFNAGNIFQFNSYTYTALEESYERERRQANALQEAFNLYAKSETSNTEEVPSFADFINKYKNELSAFLSGRIKQTDDLIVETSYLLHVKFLKYIELNNHTLYKVVERIYIGVIIASYLEANLDIETKTSNKITYFLDTKIVLEALNLQNQEDNHPILELLQLIRDSGGDIRVLDITVTEIRSIISAAVANYNRQYPTTTINEACIRNNKSRSWLTTLNSNLSKYLEQELKINISSIPDNDLKEFYASEDANELKQIWYRKNAAEHDVAAYLYVRQRRKKEHNKSHIQQATYWFITANQRLCNFNTLKKEYGNPCEIIMPQDLTSLLFLQNPQRNNSKVSRIGLGELIAQTISEEYPSRDLINEFDNVIKEGNNINKEDYVTLLTAVSQESTKKIQKLLDYRENKDVFNSEIHAMITRERNKQTEQNKLREVAIERHRKDEEEKQDLLKQLKTLATSVEELQRATISAKDENKSMREEYDKLKLKLWKRSRLWIIGVLLVIWTSLLILCFVAPSWDYNISAKLICWIASLDEDRKEIVKNILFWAYPILGVSLVYCILGIISVKVENDKKYWFKNVISRLLN